jgi:hypothetical protein
MRVAHAGRKERSSWVWVASTRVDSSGKVEKADLSRRAWAEPLKKSLGALRSQRRIRMKLLLIEMGHQGQK